MRKTPTPTSIHTLGCAGRCGARALVTAPTALKLEALFIAIALL